MLQKKMAKKKAGGNMEVLLKCEKCGGVRLYRDDDGIDKGVFCECEQKDRIERKIRKYRNMSITDRNNSQDIFENAKTGNKAEEDIYIKFKKYAENFHTAKQDNIGLMFVGGAGTGKTYVANCISNKVMEKGYSVLSFNLSRYLMAIRENFPEEEKLLNAVKTADLLFIDDVGSEKLTDWGLEKVFNLIDMRYRANLPIMITTNLKISDLKKHLNFNESDKIVDRMVEMTKVFQFDWESKRKQKNKNKESFWENIA